MTAVHDVPWRTSRVIPYLYLVARADAGVVIVRPLVVEVGVDAVLAAADMVTADDIAASVFRYGRLSKGDLENLGSRVRVGKRVRVEKRRVT